MDPAAQIRARSASFWRQTASHKRGQDPFRGTEGRAPGHDRVPSCWSAGTQAALTPRGEEKRTGATCLGCSCSSNKAGRIASSVQRDQNRMEFLPDLKGDHSVVVENESGLVPPSAM
jgi:hypothetical protein